MSKKKLILKISLVVAIFIVSFFAVYIGGLVFMNMQKSNIEVSKNNSSVSESSKNNKSDKNQTSASSKVQKTSNEEISSKPEKKDNKNNNNDDNYDTENSEESTDYDVSNDEESQNSDLSYTESSNENSTDDTSSKIDTDNSEQGDESVSSDETLPENLVRSLANTEYDMEYLNKHDCQQIITVNSTGAEAAISLYEKNSDGVWENADLDTDGYVGKRGVTNNSSEGSYETPYGLYEIGDAFYIDDVPETGLNSFMVTSDTYWVDDPDSEFYNQRVEGTENQDWNSAEHMIDYYSSYKYGFVIEFNTANTIPGKGSAIFFHCGSGPTAGCVSVSEDMMLAYLEKLDKNLNPYILIQ